MDSNGPSVYLAVKKRLDANRAHVRALTELSHDLERQCDWGDQDLVRLDQDLEEKMRLSKSAQDSRQLKEEQSLKVDSEHNEIKAKQEYWQNELKQTQRDLWRLRKQAEKECKQIFADQIHFSYLDLEGHDLTQLTTDLDCPEKNARLEHLKRELRTLEEELKELKQESSVGTLNQLEEEMEFLEKRRDEHQSQIDRVLGENFKLKQAIEEMKAENVAA